MSRLLSFSARFIPAKSGKTPSSLQSLKYPSTAKRSFCGVLYSGGLPLVSMFSTPHSEFVVRTQPTADPVNILNVCALSGHAPCKQRLELVISLLEEVRGRRVFLHEKVSCQAVRHHRLAYIVVKAYRRDEVCYLRGDRPFARLCGLVSVRVWEQLTAQEVQYSQRSVFILFGVGGIRCACGFVDLIHQVHSRLEYLLRGGTHLIILRIVGIIRLGKLLADLINACSCKARYRAYRGCVDRVMCREVRHTEIQRCKAEYDTGHTANDRKPFVVQRGCLNSSRNEIHQNGDCGYVCYSEFHSFPPTSAPLRGRLFCD
nr:MAG TPA: hypothetical protein [Caudoviricetes sp.]